MFCKTLKNDIKKWHTQVAYYFVALQNVTLKKLICFSEYISLFYLIDIIYFKINLHVIYILHYRKDEKYHLNLSSCINKYKSYILIFMLYY